jgi:hypothetical protein
MRANLLIVVTALTGALAGPAFAAPADVTGTGGGPTTAAKAPYTTSTGATVPNPGAVNREETGSIGRETRQDKIDNSITNGICIGCAPK